MAIGFAIHAFLGPVFRALPFFYGLPFFNKYDLLSAPFSDNLQRRENAAGPAPTMATSHFIMIYPPIAFI